jgi:NADH dehydrogenase
VIPDVNKTGAFHPPTAQHASREGRVLAANIAASVRGEALRPFTFKTLGLLASIGRRTGVARILGVNFSGFVAWWLWRTIYLSKLPGFEKKVRVALEWSLDLFFKKDFVQYLRAPQTRPLIPTDDMTLPVRAACEPSPNPPPIA